MKKDEYFLSMGKFISKKFEIILNCKILGVLPWALPIKHCFGRMFNLIRGEWDKKWKREDIIKITYRKCDCVPRNSKRNTWETIRHNNLVRRAISRSNSFSPYETEITYNDVLVSHCCYNKVQ